MSNTLPEKSAMEGALRQILNCDDSQIKLPAFLSKQQGEQLCQQLSCTLEQLAEAMLPLVAQFSVAPRSNFHVGAIAVTKGDELYFGANYELDYGSLNGSLHAEQSAIFNAYSHQDKPLRCLVINAAPCGLCRQFIQELGCAPDLTLIFSQQQFPFGEVLPQAFGPCDLGIEDGLCPASPSPVSGEQAAKASYSPYTGVKSALTARIGDKQLALSYYMENAAYNPSLSPLLSLLSQLRLQDYDLSEVDAIELWEPAEQMFSYQAELEQFCQHQQGISLEIHHYD
ncbi:cytidine deaminase [Aliagarivorans marinus]|uniref:cytidine deaminase n=1 Tax=Aliagarivorans marinus TaxID=561965 RepID=UPI000422EE64|nr:cytidine deaminase [Aliagarivorans marinus]